MASGPPVLLLLSLCLLSNHRESQAQTEVLCDLGCRCPEEGQSPMFLDCSRRGLTRLPASLHLDPSVTRLSFRSNRLERLREGTFSWAGAQLQELDLSLNLLASLGESGLAPLGDTLTHLRLSYNRLGPHLEGLDGLFQLRLLDLGHNAIRQLQPLAFETTPRLQELRLQSNPIFQLSGNAFRYLPHLEKLDLQDTGLVALPAHLFVPTPRLHWLSLATNALERVPREALAHAHHLEILDLSDNDFLALGEGAFRELSNISVLYLNSMDRLTRIEKNALAGLVNLRSLSCSYNKKLSYIDTEAFGEYNTTNERSTPKQQLYLRQNALRSLTSPLELGAWSSLTFVDLGENPWKCDCQLRWMFELKLETQSNIRCNSPRQLQGRTFNTMKPSELQCDSSWALVTVAVVAASMVAFCLVMLAAMGIVCSRTPAGLYVRAKQQFSYEKVQPKTETVDLEWDPSADM